MRRHFLGALCALLLAPAAPATAQNHLDLTDEAAASLIEFHNAPTTSRIAGDALIADGTELRGDVAFLNGPLVIEGAVVGRILLINGTAILEPGARVVGELIVVGGDVEGVADAIIEGRVDVYPEALQYRQAGELIQPEAPQAIAGVSAGREFPFGRTSFSIAMSGAYNRVEGLPVAFGPRVAFGRSNPTVVEALMIYRTAGGFTLEERQLGHLIRAEQFLGGHGRVRLGATVRSQVVPIEAAGVSDTESALATFVLHRDYRDHYQRDGWSAYLRWTNDRRALDATLEYRDEEHRARAAMSPWALFDNGQPYRMQPGVGEGSLRSLVFSIEHDSRNELANPSSGWWLRFETEQGIGGRMTVLPDAAGVPVAPTPGAYGVDENFSAGSLDARRYLRLGPLTRVAVRAWAAGSLDGGPLPPQREHALGGEGTMPGFDLFAFDCNARSGERVEEFGWIRSYGCDRAVLGQVSLERTLPFIRPLGRSLGLDFDFGHEPALALFADVGRAWNEGEPVPEQPEVDYDVGIGLRFGRIGAYWAVPLSRDGGVNFFVRIGPRI